ncbi:hypothetical protein [Roseococcus pinisoli]|uniref:Lipoprotein n=1 Tax=Roseococcus pinisoli TaxID=2835040 RepID=A0ABS5Q9V7_9PROT|nr:hypothetical protein [Roseococcus pinisoli]MBS7810283.1 hypothetical protein [Roseococcus pinisoli]
MLKRLSVLPLLILATACATTATRSSDPAVRRAQMQALPAQGSCQPVQPEGARACTMRLGTKEVRVSQFRNLTTIRYNEADTAEPAFLNDMRRVLTTAETPEIDRAMSVISSHGMSGVMVDFTSGCFADSSTPAAQGRACFVSLTY